MAKTARKTARKTAKKRVTKRVPKRIIKDKASSIDGRIFTVDRSGTKGEIVMLDFGKQVKYRVVKLSTVGLPAKTAEGKKITWVTNFGVKAPKGGKYVKRVKYTLYLRGRSKTFVYFAAGGIKTAKPRKNTSKKFPKSFVKVVLNVGDPAAGWT